MSRSFLNSGTLIVNMFLILSKKIEEDLEQDFFVYFQTKHLPCQNN